MSLNMASATKDAQSSVTCVHCKACASHYCNTCFEAMCGKCKNRHIKRQKNHQVVLYKAKEDPNMVAERCRIHPEIVFMMVCENCSVPVCTKCIKDNHRGHIFGDLYEDFIAKHNLCKQVVNDLKREVLPQSDALLSDVKHDFITCKRTFGDIRSKMTSTSNKLKEIVDKILEEKIAGVEKLQKSTEITLKEQEEAINKHIKHLEQIVLKYEQIEKVNKPSEFILFHKENNLSNIPAIPDLYQINLPSYSKTEIDNLSLMAQFGIIKETKLQPVLRSVKPTGKKEEKYQRTDDREKCTLRTNKPPTVEQVSTFTIESVCQIRHISRQGSKMWISDNHGNLVLSDSIGQIIDTVTDDIYADDGLHTVTQSGDLLIVDECKNIVSKRNQVDKTIETVINTGEWSPKSVFCSPINGDILVGMKRGENMFSTMGQPSGAIGMVAVYNSSYNRLREIRFDKDGKELFCLIIYVTQNINGDICVSDFDKKSVIAVDELGKYKFTYSGNPVDPSFHPTGICCDSKGNILVFNSSCSTIHLLDRSGNFLSLLLDLSYTMRGLFTSSGPIGICFDEKENLWVGTYVAPDVRVFKYIYSDT